MKHRRASAGDNFVGRVAMDARVRVYPGTDTEARGVVVEDFGEFAGQAVDIGKRIVSPARRWAVMLDTGDLVFVDTEHLVAEPNRHR